MPPKPPIELTPAPLAGVLDRGRRMLETAAKDRTPGDVAGDAMGALRAVFEDVGARPAVALAIAYLEPRGGPSALSLVASRGLEDLRDEAKAVPRSIERPAVDALARFPILGPTARSLGLDPSRARSVAPPLPVPGATAGVESFYVSDLGGDAAAPLARATGAASVFGVACRLPGRRLFVAVAFCRGEIEAAGARAFELLGQYARLALLETEDVAAGLDEPAMRREREAALRQVLALQGAAIARWEVGNDLRRERTQRAMLNVIEDLREARAGLEVKVRERTRDLAAANQLLSLRNQDLEEFAYIASHDLQEPLRTISGYLQIIARRYKGALGPEADEFITFATEGATRMQQLLESLLVYSRVTMKHQPTVVVSLDRALDAALENLGLALQESGACVDREPLPAIRADAVQMTQLLQNLLSNAVKFRGDRAPAIRIACTAASDFWDLSVRDEGIGMNPRYTDRIFKIFRRLQRDTPGTGVGLAICKKIAERHGGHIQVETAPGQGSTFHVFLPMNPPEDRHV